MRPELQKKVDQAVKLLQITAGEDTVEVAYSGGKDSDVILELAKMAGIKYRAIYKNTTIDPPSPSGIVWRMVWKSESQKRRSFKSYQHAAFRAGGRGSAAEY